MSHLRTDARRAYEREWARKNRIKNAARLSETRRARYAANESVRKKNYEFHKKWVAKNKERVAAYHKEYSVKNRDKFRIGKMLKNFNITKDEYIALFKKQKGVCGICKKPERSRHQAGTLRYLAIDHDHFSGRVRGLLCSRCNLAVGGFYDDVQLLKAAIRYIQKHRKPA